MAFHSPFKKKFKLSRLPFESAIKNKMKLKAINAYSKQNFLKTAN